MLLRPVFQLIVYLVIAVVASVQIYSFGTHEFQMPKSNFNSLDVVNNVDTLKRYLGHSFTEYNNYVVFKNSWTHLRQAKNLYTIYPAEQWDLYKYSPTFALLFAPLANLPDLPGLIIWNVLNALALLFALRMLPLSKTAIALIGWLILPELVTSLQNSQSNALLAALIIGAFGCLQRGRLVPATLWLVLATYIKLYGAIGFCLFLFYPGKWRFVLYSAGWSVLLFVLPLIVVPWQGLLWQYHNWAAMLAADRSASYGLSVMGWLHSWFGLDQGKGVVTLFGLLFFLLPLVRYRLYSSELYRLLMVAYMLIWVIIFNHKAESPTYVIALTGVVIWYFAHSRPRATWRTVLLWISFIGTTLTTTDLFPNAWKTNFFVPYVIKAIPSILVWFVILIELMTLPLSRKPATD
jgi:Glycosyltransferase family 87